MTVRSPAIPSSDGLGETCLRLGEGVVSLALLVVLVCSRAEPAGLLAQAIRVSDDPFAFSKRSMTFRTLDDAARIGTLPARLRLACRLVGWGDVFADDAAAASGDASAAANSGVAGGVAIIAQVPRQLGNNLTADNLSLDFVAGPIAICRPLDQRGWEWKLAVVLP